MPVIAVVAMLIGIWFGMSAGYKHAASRRSSSVASDYRATDVKRASTDRIPSYIKDDGTSIRVTTFEGKEVVLKSEQKDEHYRFNRLLDMMGGYRYILFDILLADGEQNYLMLNRKNGAQISLKTEPVFSSDSKYFFAKPISYSIDGAELDVIQIWEMTESGATPAFTIGSKEWVPGNASWWEFRTIAAEKLNPITKEGTKKTFIIKQSGRDWIYEDKDLVGKKFENTEVPLEIRTLLNVVVGKDTLKSAESKFGKTGRIVTGDAAEAETKICYQARNPANVVLTFASNMESSGEEQEITDLRVVQNPDAQMGKSCAVLPNPSSAISNEAGLKLGLSKSEVKKLIGIPHNEINDEWHFVWSKTYKLNPEDKNYEHWNVRRAECFEGKEPYYTAQSGLTIRFQNDKVIYFAITRAKPMC